MTYTICFHKNALIQIHKLKLAKLDNQAKAIIDKIKTNPFEHPSLYEKLIGNLSGTYSRRINIQHRIVYEVNLEDKVIRILSMWTQQ